MAIDIVVEDYREFGFHEYILANPINMISFGLDEEAMPGPRIWECQVFYT